MNPRYQTVPWPDKFYFPHCCARPRQTLASLLPRRGLTSLRFLSRQFPNSVAPGSLIYRAFTSYSVLSVIYDTASVPVPVPVSAPEFLLLLPLLLFLLFSRHCLSDGLAVRPIAQLSRHFPISRSHFPWKPGGWIARSSSPRSRRWFSSAGRQIV